MELKDVKTAEDFEKLDPKTKRKYQWIGAAIALVVIVFGIKLCSPTQGTYEEGWQDIYIVGLDPENTWLNLKQWGFKVKMDFDNEWGNTWTCTREDLGITYTVVIYSPKHETKAQNITMTIQVEPGIVDISNGKQLAEKVATVPYDLANVELAKTFIQEHYNSKSATLIIGDAKFTIEAPSYTTRVLKIEKHI